VLFAGLMLMIVVLMTRGIEWALVVMLLLAGFLGVVLLRDRHGRTLLDRALNRATWMSARSKGAHIYRSGPLGRVPWGTNQLPGLAAPIRLSEYRDSYGRPFALLHSPAALTYSVVIATEPDGASLVDAEQIDSWVANYGAWLAMLGNEPQLQGASVTIETAPDTGSRLRREISTNTDPDAPAFARALLADVMEAYPSGSSTVRAYVTVTYGATRTGKKRTEEEMGREIAARLPGLTSALELTGTRAARPVAAADLCELVRTAFDPDTQQLFDQAHADGEPVTITWTEVGPSATQQSWTGYRHDAAYSKSWVMTAAPRGTVTASVLTRLLEPHADMLRKRVTLLYEPIDPARAAGLVEADRRNAEFRVSSSQRPSARDMLDMRQASQTATEEAAGAGLVNFAMVVTATASDDVDTAELEATVDGLSASSRIQLRPAYGSQDVAFLTSLPLGIIPSKHVRVPTELRDKL
jgi:hypothetical protein